MSSGIGQAVYYKKKRDKRWFPYYRFTAQLRNKTYLVSNQQTGELKHAHSKQLQKAHLSWKVPKQGPTGRPFQKSTLAKRPNDSTGLSSSESNTSTISRASPQTSEPESETAPIRNNKHHAGLLRKTLNIPSGPSETIPPWK